MNNYSFKDQLKGIKSCLDLINLNEFQGRLDASVRLLVSTRSRDKPVFVFGNSGSAADSQHIAGELVGKFLKERRDLNVRDLSVNTSVITAWANDVRYKTDFARQVEAYGEYDAVLWVISTSGNSRNVILAEKKAKELAMHVIAMTGEGGGALSEVADILLSAPSNLIARIQEVYMMVYHYLCQQVEAQF